MSLPKFNFTIVDMTDCKIQLDRLSRHYHRSLDHYDQISFLDLAHSLRIWTELKEVIDKILPVPTFQKSLVTKKMRRLLRGAEYSYAHLPGGVTTSAVAAKDIEGRSIIYGPHDGEKFSVGAMVKFEQNYEMSLAQFLLIYRVLSPEEVKILNDESQNIPIEKISFSKYMESPAILFNFSAHEPKSISNEQLIKRIANEYQGSHADASETNFEIYNVYSEPVKKLMTYGCAKLPLPYFILLHIAKTIIDNVKIN